MSQLSVLLVLALAVISATGLSVDSEHVRGGRQMWREQGQGLGSVSRVSHAGNSNNFRQVNRIVSPQRQEPKPSASICKAAGFFSNPDSCTDFHRCVDWTGKNIRFSIFHFTCPAGTIFDNSLGICNHPWAVQRPECTGFQQPLVVHSTQPPTGWTQGSTSSWSQGSSTGWTQSPSTSWTQPPTIAPQGNNTNQVPPKPFTLECKQNNKYSRHPLYCNRYYYCIWDSDTADWTFPSFTCPKGLLFDEHSQQCSFTAAPCDGILAPSDPHSFTTKPTTTSSTKRPTNAWEQTTPEDLATTDFTGITPSTEKTWEVDPTSSHNCPAPGYYPFEGDCIRFYKCVETEEGQLKGLLYRCPNGYGYHEVRQRCRKEHELPKCERFMTEALYRVEAARPLYVEDLKWFFVN